MLNPVSKSLIVSDTDVSKAASDLDIAISAAVTAAQALPNIILNQITIVPLGTIFDGTNYTASATVLTSFSS